MTIIDTTTVSVLFALVAIAVLTGVAAVSIALVRVHAAGRPARVAAAPKSYAFLHGRYAH
jgi:hypothetical protein